MIWNQGNTKEERQFIKEKAEDVSTSIANSLLFVDKSIREEVGYKIVKQALKIAIYDLSSESFIEEQVKEHGEKNRKEITKNIMELYN